MFRIIVPLTALVLCGCLDALEEQTKKSPNSIIGKTTQDIGKFDPDAGAAVSDSKVEIKDPITAPVTAPLQAYGPMLERLSKSEISYAVRLYEAEHGRYPEDYEEFMEQIIRKNNIRLPVLPGNKKYQYDEVNHELVVVDAAAENAPPADGGEPAADPAAGGQLPGQLQNLPLPGRP